MQFENAGEKMQIARITLSGTKFVCLSKITRALLKRRKISEGLSVINLI